MEGVEKLQQEIDGATAKMKDNINMMAERDEQLHNISDKSSSLHDTTSAFQQQAKTLEEQQRMRNYKIIAAGIAILIFFILCTVYKDHAIYLWIAALVVVLAGVFVYRMKKTEIAIAAYSMENFARGVNAAE